MQLDPKDELVLISGMAPIRAKKLRYFEDTLFKARRLPPPGLDGAGHPDRPVPRPNDWGSLARRTDARLAALVDEDAGADDGGLQQQRAPDLADDLPSAAEPPRQLDLLGLESDDADPAADKRTMDRTRGAQDDIQRAHGINQGEGDDTLPSF